MLQNLLVMYMCDPVAIQCLDTSTQLFSVEVSSWSWHCTQTCSILIFSFLSPILIFSFLSPFFVLIFSFLSQSAEMKMVLPQPVDAHVQEQGSSS